MSNLFADNTVLPEVYESSTKTLRMRLVGEDEVIPETTTEKNLYFLKSNYNIVKLFFINSSGVIFKDDSVFN